MSKTATTSKTEPNAKPRSKKVKGLAGLIGTTEGDVDRTYAAAAPRRKASESFDWSEFDALTDEQVVAAALADPDAQPLTDADFKRMKRKPRCYSIRIALRMTQEQFAEAFRIPVGTIRDWEQWRAEPDQAAKAYLKVIAVNPQYVMKALAHVPGQPRPKAD